MDRFMETDGSETRLYVTTVAPCLCTPGDDGIHGFTIVDGERKGMYLASRRTTGAVHWLDVAFSVGHGAVALRAWIDLRTRKLRVRVLAPNEVQDHPATTLGGWLHAEDVSVLTLDLHAFVTRLVLGDDRLSAHLWDNDEAALCPTALAAPIGARERSDRESVIAVAS
jgi:hypothetical protein